MFSLIIGGSGSGKSALAETKVCKLNTENKYYLATMQVYGEEGLLKVKRHQRLRANKGFETIECQRNISEVQSRLKENSTVLLECVTNLVANEMFDEGSAKETAYVVDKITKEILIIKNTVSNLVVVTGNVAEDGTTYDASTMKYIRALNQINANLADACDEFIEVVAGIPVVLKGEKRLK